MLEIVAEHYLKLLAKLVALVANFLREQRRATRPLVPLLTRNLRVGDFVVGAIITFQIGNLLELLDVVEGADRPTA